ncbi:cytochrome P450 [Apiospora arundinis]|uniref:Cytochrome P450 n=1 Tax=Apiospora arundinis TaxID=335852 RepID=A0ABR2IUF0_9PEZI
MQSFLSTLVGVAAVIYISLMALQRLTQDEDEPRTIYDGVPLATPVFGIISKGLDFHLQSQYRTHSFTAIVATIGANLVGVSKATNEIIGRDKTQDNGYFMSFPKYVHHVLSEGPGLDAMNRKSTQVLADWVVTLAKETTPKTIKMMQWIRHELFTATTDAVYRPRNPSRDPEMEQAWYNFEPKLMVFILKLWPRVFAKKAYQAREHMVEAWERYFDEGWYKQGSALIKARVEINDDFQIPLKETARLEIGGTLPILANTHPAVFWAVYHVFSDPFVLTDIRAELLNGVQEDPVTGTCMIDLGFVAVSCPILLSTVKEAIRLYGCTLTIRIVMEDHRLDNTFLLKKGSTMLMPAQVQHIDHDVWGGDVDAFNHHRFLREPSGGGRSQSVNPFAFRAFSGGTTLCPGRHFATTEMMVLTALLALRFDVYPTNGKWAAPTTPNTPTANAMMLPDWDLEVALHPRDGGHKDRKVSFSGHEQAMEISAEDIEGTKPHSGD